MMTYNVKQAAQKIGVGRNNLLAIMRSHNWLHSQGNHRNGATKYACETGLLVPTITEYHKGPMKVLHATVRVTAKGLTYLQDLIDEMDETRRPLPAERSQLLGPQSDLRSSDPIHRMGATGS